MVLSWLRVLLFVSTALTVAVKGEKNKSTALV